MNSKQRDRIIGLLFISAFPLYGGGTALLDSSSPALGLSFILGNSLVVIIIGRMLQKIVIATSTQGQNEIAAHVYFSVRLLEALLLAIAGCITYRYNVRVDDVTEVTSKFTVSPFYYRVSMVGLGIGSLPLLTALMRTKLIPHWLGWFGLVAYTLIACGNIASTITDDEQVGLTLQYPGALFELTFAMFLIVSGFATDTDSNNDSNHDGNNESSPLLNK